MFIILFRLGMFRWSFMWAGGRPCQWFLCEHPAHFSLRRSCRCFLWQTCTACSENGCIQLDSSRKVHVFPKMYGILKLFWYFLRKLPLVRKYISHFSKFWIYFASTLKPWLPFVNLYLSENCPNFLGMRRRLCKNWLPVWFRIWIINFTNFINFSNFGNLRIKFNKFRNLKNKFQKPWLICVLRQRVLW